MVEQYFVVAGLSVFERQAFWINKNTESLALRCLDGAVELHASEISNHSKQPWNSLKAEERHALVGSVYDLLAASKCVLFGVAVHKTSFPSQDPVALPFQELCLRFDRYLARLHNAGDSQRGIMVFDKTRHEMYLQTLLHQFRASGTARGRVYNFAEVPLFADCGVLGCCNSLTSVPTYFFVVLNEAMLRIWTVFFLASIRPMRGCTGWCI